MCVCIYLCIYRERSGGVCGYTLRFTFGSLVSLGCGNVVCLFYLFSLLPIISLSLIYEYGSNHAILELPIDTTENIENNKNSQEFLNLINSKTWDIFKT